MKFLKSVVVLSFVWSSLFAQEFVPYDFSDIDTQAASGKTVKKLIQKDTSGHVIAAGRVANGKKDGKWLYYGAHNTPRVQARFEDGKLHGRYMQYYPASASIQVIAFFENGLLQGDYLQFLENGNIAYKGYYKENRKSGNWTEYVEGLEVSVAPYKNGKIEGEFVVKSLETGKKIESYSYVAGEKNGTYRRYNHYGKLLTSGLYENGKRSGTWKNYHYGKHVSSEYSFNTAGEIHGDSLAYFNNGELKARKNFVNGRPAGSCYDKHSPKIFALKATYSPEHELTGEYLENHSNGMTKTEGFYKEGKKQGVWKSYDIEGSLLALGSYKNGQKDGLWKNFSTKGVLLSEGKYQRGVPCGQWFFYHDNGKIQSLGSFSEHGGRVGVWGNFYSTGTLMQENRWENGFLVQIGDVFSPKNKKKLPKGTFSRGSGSVLIYNDKGQLIREENY
ncbi:MAG: hypothetical protein MI784_17765, partial [Cytophagales bacterium]|nr:hypothetical protein [Cytophagales bacterium]